MIDNDFPDFNWEWCFSWSVNTLKYLCNCCWIVAANRGIWFFCSANTSNVILIDCLYFFYFSTERSWIEQGYKVGEQVIPLARNFNGVSTDIESQNVPLVRFHLHWVYSVICLPFSWNRKMFGTSTLWTPCPLFWNSFLGSESLEIVCLIILHLLDMETGKVQITSLGPKPVRWCAILCTSSHHEVASCSDV